MTAETIWVRTESGVVLEMDLPLAEGIGQRLARGEIVRVANAAGDRWEDPAVESEPDPRDREIARLRALLAGAGVDPDSEPVDDSGGEPPGPKRPAPSANKAEWVGWAVGHPDESRRMTPDDAEALTKNDLVERYGPKPE